MEQEGPSAQQETAMQEQHKAEEPTQGTEVASRTPGEATLDTAPEDISLATLCPLKHQASGGLQAEQAPPATGRTLPATEGLCPRRERQREGSDTATLWVQGLPALGTEYRDPTDHSLIDLSPLQPDVTKETLTNR